MLANESQRIRKGGQGFGIPGGLSNGKRLLTQQVMSKNGHERKESQQGRCGAHNRHIRPLALGLDSLFNDDCFWRIASWENLTVTEENAS